MLDAFITTLLVLMIITLCIVFTVKISISITNEDLKKRDEALANIQSTIDLLVKQQKSLKRKKND